MGMSEMAEMALLRLQLQADPSQLIGFDSEAALEQARSRLRESRDDVQVTHVELLSAGTVGVVFLAQPLSVEGIDDVATELRAALGIGPGINRLMSGPVRGVRGLGGGESWSIGGRDSTCGDCGIPGGRHLTGCPQSSAR